MALPIQSELRELWEYLTPHERAELDRLLATTKPAIWIPQEGPQRQAYESDADEVWYGGAGMGGKSDLEIGLSLTRHERSLILRARFDDLEYLENRSLKILAEAGISYGWNGQKHRLVFDRDGGDVEVYFGYLAAEDDWERYAGRPFDLICYDEVTQMLRLPVRTLAGWNRTTTKGQRVRRVYTFNPPSPGQGIWVYDEINAWLAYIFPDQFDHPNPAAPNETRWFAPEGDEVREVDGPGIILVNDLPVEPFSRTFIPAKVSDNKYADEAQYRRSLQSVPEPKRSQMLYGDMAAGMNDDEWQLIPTAWVLAAQERWKAGKPDGAKLSGLGIDVARGGDDNTVIAAGYDWWVAELSTIPGKLTPNGQSVVDAIERMYESIEDLGRVPECIDVVGVGAAPYDKARESGHRIYAVQAAGASTRRTRAGLGFVNQRAEMLWDLRDALDPDGEVRLALPSDRLLVPEITSIRWRESPRGIKIEDKDDIKKRLGRSPDRAEAVALLLKALRKSR